MVIKSLAQTLKDLATGIKNTITGVTGSNATLTITKGNGTTSTVTINNVANATNATKATQDSAGQQINTTYIKGLSVSGKTVTYTKGNGTTGTITTQDTVYTHPNSGVTAGTYRSVTVNAQGHVTGGSNPTTLSGYGITDAPTKTGSGASGTWNINVSGKANTAGTADTATNADKLDGYHYTDIINNVKSSISSRVMGAPNWAGKITASGNNTPDGFTAPANGFCYGGGSNITHYINGVSYSLAGVLIPVKKGDKFRTAANITVYFIPCS